MRNKRVLIIGARKSGKTSITKWLNNGEVKQVQNIQYSKMAIDTPGAYLESPWMHSHLISSQMDAYCVLMLVNQKDKRFVYPPKFANSFNVPVIGVITNSDKNLENRESCIKQLELIGIKEPYYFITENVESFNDLREVILEYENKIK